MMKLQILGSGCAKCATLGQHTSESPRRRWAWSMNWRR
jgi:hypothetical protein